MNDNRLVYSTEKGRICAECSRSVSTCVCKKKKKVKTGRQKTGHPADGIVRIRREVKGRRGKTVTTVFGIPLENKELKLLAKKLKQRCGTGGSVKDGIIVIQGDHRHTLVDEIKKHGFSVKITGG